MSGYLLGGQGAFTETICTAGFKNEALNDCCSCKIVPSFLYSGETDDDTSIIAQLFAVKCCGDIKV